MTHLFKSTLQLLEGPFIRSKAVVNAVKGNNVVKASACWIQVSDGLGPQKKMTFLLNVQSNPQMDLQDKGVIDSGCSRHMTGNMSYLTDYEEIDGGYVAFGGNPKEGKITGKCTIKTGNLDFKNVYFVKELKFNLFSVSQMCDKRNSVLFNNTECIVLSPNFKLIDESQVLLRVPRKNNMYSIDLNNIIPKGGLTCLFAKATSDESRLWHRSSTVRKKVFMKKMISLVVTDDYSRFTLVFFLATKDEISGILKSFITRIENLVDHKVKVIRCDNGTKFKNREMNQFCEKKDHLGKFDGKADEGFFIGYSLNSKAFRAFNSRTRIVKENLHIRFSENTPNTEGIRPDWLFDIDALTRIMNYEPIVTSIQSNGFAGTKVIDNAGQARKETEPVKDYILLPLWPTDPPYSQDPKSSHDDGSKPSSDDGKKVDEDLRKIVNVMIKRRKTTLTALTMLMLLAQIRYKGDILLVQVNVDDIIFGSTKKELCIEFEKLMHEKFQMSSMAELTFFLGLQVQ
ncbi:ribonuclease H-like domain-containing protein [Tanacetum coccineum]